MGGSSLDDPQAVGIAFAMTAAAGLSTVLGAAVVFWPGDLVTIARPSTLAAALGFSAGVMLFVSFQEILSKAQDAFLDAGLVEGSAHAAATGCFFGGILLTVCLDAAVHWLDAASTGAMHKAERSIPDDVRKLEAAEAQGAEGVALGQPAAEQAAPCAEDVEVGLPPSHASAEEHSCGSQESPGSVHVELASLQPDSASDTASVAEASQEVGAGQAPRRQQDLMRTGLVTALAIGLHNFPEGLATFVAALADPTVGAALAVAIAIHNIPEGCAVAIPVYYATGSRWKAFVWSLLSGLFEPIGALLGYLVLSTAFSPVAYGVLFGIVGGMMVWICVSELLPTALKYDQDERIAIPALGAGMLVMAVSLVLFAV